jgi:hypothetical protein
MKYLERERESVLEFEYNEKQLIAEKKKEGSKLISKTISHTTESTQSVDSNGNSLYRYIFEKTTMVDDSKPKFNNIKEK